MHKQVPRTDKFEVSEMNINNLIRCNNKNCLKSFNIAGDDLYYNFLAKIKCVFKLVAAFSNYYEVVFQVLFTIS